MVFRSQRVTLGMAPGGGGAANVGILTHSTPCCLALWQTHIFYGRFGRRSGCGCWSFSKEGAWLVKSAC